MAAWVGDLDDDRWADPRFAGHCHRDDPGSFYSGSAFITGNYMKKYFYGCLGFVLVLMALVIGSVGRVRAEVNVNINIGPPVFASEPSEVVYVPKLGFYFVPGGTYDVFFYKGYWWSRRSDRWFRARQYRGPWGVARSVPGNLRSLRPDYRVVYEKTGSRINYGQWKKNNWRPVKRLKNAGGRPKNMRGDSRKMGGKNQDRGH
jgi:hypothetical protein